MALIAGACLTSSMPVVRLGATRSRVATIAVVFLLSLTAFPLPSLSAQGPQIVVASAPYVGRAVAIIAEFLGAYGASKLVDRLVGDGAGLRDTLAGLRDELVGQARMNAANRQILLRQAAMLEGLRSDLNILLSRPPSALETYSIKSRTTSAIEELKAIQADHDLRIGRLEEGQEALRRLLASIADGRNASAPVRGQQEGTPGGPAPSPTSGNGSSRVVENDFLRVRVDAASVSGSRATVTLTIEIKSNAEEQIAVTDGSVTLIDPFVGTEWRAQENGIRGINVIPRCIATGWCMGSPYMQVSPSSRQTVILQLSLGGSAGTPSRPQSVTLAMELARRRNGTNVAQIFGIVVPNIPVSSP